MVDDLVGGTAQQKAPGAGVALVAQHEEVEAALFGVVDDALGRVARHLDGLQLDAPSGGVGAGRAVDLVVRWLY